MGVKEKVSEQGLFKKFACGRVSKGAALASGTSSPETNLPSASEPAKVTPQSRQKSSHLRRLHRLKEGQGSFRENYFPSAVSFLPPPPQLLHMQNSAMPLGLRPLDTED